MSKTQLIKDLEGLRDDYIYAAGNANDLEDFEYEAAYNGVVKKLDEILSRHQPKKEINE